MSARTAMRDRVCIGQVWRRRRDGHTFTVRQVWRPDRQAHLVGLADAPNFAEAVTVSFSDLRRLWEMVES